VRWRRWGLVLAALCGLVLAGRLVDLPENQRSSRQPPATTVPTQPASVSTLPPVPAELRRQLRLPGVRPDGSCPTSRMVGPPITKAQRVAAVAVGDGPVYPVLFRASAEGRLDPATVAYWDAPEPVDGVVIVRGHRLGAPTDQIRFRSDQQKASPTYVLNPVVAYPDGRKGQWWPPTSLHAGSGCYGLQIDGANFSEVLVVEFG